MKISLSLLLVLLFLSSCYVYKPYQAENKKETLTLKKKIQPKQYYKIKVQDRLYKVQTEKWEGDTLVSYLNMNKKKEIKFHQKDIQQVYTRQFSKGRSNALTFGLYGLLGGGLIYLLR